MTAEATKPARIVAVKVLKATHGHYLDPPVSYFGLIVAETADSVTIETQEQREPLVIPRRDIRRIRTVRKSLDEHRAKRRAAGFE